MNDDTISRQMAIDATQGIGRLATLPDNDAVIRMSAVEYVLFNLPSAQPEIIRCKDCKWSAEHYDIDGNAPYWICNNWDAGTDEDGFCYEAERRTDEASMG